MAVKEAADLLQRSELVVREHYALGELLSVRQIHGGYINLSFELTARTADGECRYLLRRYDPKTPAEHIRFEHAVIEHLRKNGFFLAAGVIPRPDGETFVEERRRVNGREVTRFWAVFAFSRGEVRYSFADTNLSEEELISSANVLALLHEAGRDFEQPAGTRSAKPKICEYLQIFPRLYAGYVETAGDTRVDHAFLDHREEILKRVEAGVIPDSTLERMPELPVHGDYHQGNLTYEGSEVVGVFDFDWTKIDLRLFDLAQALLYFCASWDGEQGGRLDLDRYGLFLRSYNDRCGRGTEPGPLSGVEQSELPRMLTATNQFVLYSIIRSFYDTEDASVDLWMVAVHQYLGMMRWLAAEEGRILETTHSACSS